MSTYPFGRPATDRPPHVPRGDADVFVLGVYASALHVRWQRPDGGVMVQALAVDDEPEVFWDGADAAERITTWRRDVGWQRGWGQVTSSGNGTSGRALADDVLDPLGTSLARCRVTDCLPRYLVKHGLGSQGQAMERVYGPFAAARGLPPVSLPRRPSDPALVRQAVTEDRGSLLAQIRECGADTVVTVGQPAADVLAAVLGIDRVALRDDADYGREQAVRLGRGLLAWLPLKHPGQRSTQWTRRHQEWKDLVRRR